MFVYSSKIIQFVKELKKELSLVLSREVGLKVRGDRFYDERQRCSYPIKVVIYNQKSMVGYFDPSFYELGFHEKLFYVKKDHWMNVLRHELAHYLTFIEYGECGVPHGEAFRKICQRYKWGEEVSRASIALEEVLEENEGTALSRKIQKLLALAKSSNSHEAESAMLKSRELLLKHNMEESAFAEEGDRFILKRILKQTKEDAKMRAIAQILETFFVSIVYNRSTDATYLEILGEEAHVEVAEYIAIFLTSELERLWMEAKKKARLQGLREKNSFFMGIAMGYLKKVHSLKREADPAETKALLVIEKQLIFAREMAYQRLSSSTRGGKYSKNAASIGEKMGREMTIHSAVTSTKSPLLIL